MSDFLRPLLALLPVLWQKRWWGLAVAWVVVVLGAFGIMQYKERHMATATIFVDTQSALRPLMDGLTVHLDIGQQANMLARNLLSPPNIRKLIDQNHLLPNGSTPEKRAQLVQQLMKAIKIKIDSRDNLYQITYVGTRPQQTLELVKSVVNLFVHQGVTSNQEDSAHALQFINQQIDIYNKNLVDVENKLKNFKLEHPSYSGTNTTNYYSQVSQLQDQMGLLQGQLSSASSSRNTLQQQLTSISPNLSIGTPAGSATGLPGQPLSTDQRISFLRSKLNDLLQRYTEAYPDVIATQQAIARLEKQKQQDGQGAGSSTTGDVNSPGATNPVYQQLRVNLALADANIASLKSQAQNTQSRLAQLQTQANEIPKLDEEYAQLNRNYGLLNDSYQKLVQRREAAVLSSNQDKSSGQGYFNIVDPPRLNPMALFPRRTFLIALLLLVAVGLGVSTTFLLVLLFPTFNNLSELRRSIDRPVLGAISLARTPAQITRDRASHALFLLCSCLLVAAVSTWTVLNALHLIHYG